MKYPGYLSSPDALPVSGELIAVNGFLLEENYEEALATVLNALESHTGAPSAVSAQNMFNKVLGGIRAVLAENPGAAPSLNLSQTSADMGALLEQYRSPDARYALMEVYYVFGDHERNRDNLAGALPYAERILEIGRRYSEAGVAHPLQLELLGFYHGAAQLLGGEDYAACIQDLRQLAREGEHSFAKWSAQFVLASEYEQYQGSSAEVTLLFGAMIGNLDASGALAVLADGAVYPWLKATVATAIGSAFYAIGDNPGAIAYFERSTTYTKGTEAKAMASYYLADIAARQNPYDPNEAIAAYQDLIARYPRDHHAGRGLLRMAALYHAHGELAQALSLYEELLVRYSESPAAPAARQAIDYIMNHQWGTVEVAALEPTAAQEPDTLAMHCGPYALRDLLARKGIACDVTDLAAAAGTDATGTAMAGLARAARAHGVELAGVTASAPEELAPPFIALLDGDHFVLVAAQDAEGLRIVDSGQPESRMPRPEFVARWGGAALVAGEAASVARALGSEAMETLRGGTNSGQGIPQDEEEEDCDEDSSDCPCEDGDNGNDPLNGLGGGGGGGGGRGGLQWTGPDRHRSTIAGSPGSPDATSGFDGFGVRAKIDTFETSLEINAKDLSLKTLGAWSLSMSRHYRSDQGFPRPETSSTSKWWENNIGAGWSHSLNMHLRTSGGATPSTVVYWDASGSTRTYTYDSTSGGYDWYYRSATGNPSELGNTLKRNATTKKFTLELSSGALIEFSAATTSGDYIARVEALVDDAGNTTTFVYNSSNVATGKLTKVQSPAGDAQHLAFTYSGNLITKVELKKNTTVLNSVSYAYNGSNELVTVTDHASKTVQYAYGSDTNAPGSRFITEITNKKGVSADLAWTFGLNAMSDYEAYMIEVDNADGLTTVYDRSLTTNICTISNWDATTLLTKVVNTPVTGTTARSRYIDYYVDATTYERWGYEYDSARNLTRVAAPGDVDYAEYTHNSVGNVLTEQFGAGPITEYEYDGTGQNLTKVIDPAGIETDYTYDVDGNLEKMEHPSLHVNGYQYDYDAYGQLTQETSPLGTVTEYTYDALGRLTEAVQDVGGLEITTLYAYDDYGNMIEMTDPRGKVTEYEYGDPSCGGCGGGGNLELVRDALNRETAWIYNSDGQLETTIDASGIETDYTYDSMGRLIEIEHPAGSAITSTITYNKLGQVASRTDFGGSTVSYEYDHMGRVTKVTDAVGDIDYAYNSLGLLVSVTDSLGQVTTNAYDTAFRLTKVTDDIGKETHYTYDSAGRQSTVGAGTSGTVDVTTYSYDSTTGLLDSVEYGSSTYTANYEYDGEARLVKLTDWIDAVDGLRYDYDAVGRLVEITDYDDSTLTYTYDAAGNVLSMNDYHGNTTSYTYNDIGQLASITAPGSKVWSYTYDTGNRLTRVDIPNGMHTEYTYDASGRQDAIHHKDGTTIVQGFDYTFDDGGNITKITHEDRAYWEYDYDGRDRLIEAERYDDTPTLLHRYTYTYDDGDNMLTKAVYDPAGPSTVTTTYTYNDANEQTNMDDGTASIDMTYDEWGRLVEKDDGAHTATYAYRYGSKLYSVTSDFPGEGNVTYETGGDGKRRSRVAGASETWYNYTVGFDVVSTEDDANGSTGELMMTNVVLAPTGAVSAIFGDLAGTTPGTGTVRYYATDHLGSTRSAWNASKVAVGTYEFTPYGGEYMHTGAALDTLAGAYTGKPWDDLAQLFHFPFRQYSPDTARWTTRDPLGMVDGPNLYLYVSQNPLVLNDIYGLTDNSVNASARNNPQQFMDLMLRQNSPCITKETLAALRKGIDKAMKGHTKAYMDHLKRLTEYMNKLKDTPACEVGKIKDLQNAILAMQTHMKRIAKTMGKLKSTYRKFMDKVEVGPTCSLP